MKKRKLTLKRLDPWSVLKFGLVANTVGLAILLVAARIVWYFVTRLDLIGQICETAGKVAVDLESCGIDGGGLFKQVFIVGLMGVVVATGVQVFVAFLYNLIADLTGGLTFTFFDDSVGEEGAMTARGGSVAAPTGAGDPSLAREQRLREAAEREEQRRTTRSPRTSREAMTPGGAVSTPAAAAGAGAGSATSASAASAATTSRSERLKQQLTGERTTPTASEDPTRVIAKPTASSAPTAPRPAQSERSSPTQPSTPQRHAEPAQSDRLSAPSTQPTSSQRPAESAERPESPAAQPQRPTTHAPSSGADNRPERTRTYERTAEPTGPRPAEPGPATPSPESRPDTPHSEGDDDPIFGDR